MNNGQKAFYEACFVAGTPLLTPDGCKPIEQFQEGDLLLSCDENNPNGPIEAKVVEEVFVRAAAILNLHVGGRTIQTTSEHPFFVLGKGWLPCRELRAGDLLATHDGRWVRVDDTCTAGEVTVVYNVRVADFHTYFVGSPDWGFSVWACTFRELFRD